MALSTTSSGVTQTGQPGPCTSSIWGGIRVSMPYRIRVWVCPPQISIRTHGRVVLRSNAARRARAILASRYSSMCFMGLLPAYRALLWKHDQTHRSRTSGGDPRVGRRATAATGDRHSARAVQSLASISDGLPDPRLVSRCQVRHMGALGAAIGSRDGRLVRAADVHTGAPPVQLPRQDLRPPVEVRL